jgi:hypothetical protein
METKQQQGFQFCCGIQHASHVKRMS